MNKYMINYMNTLYEENNEYLFQVFAVKYPDIFKAWQDEKRYEKQQEIKRKEANI